MTLVRFFLARRMAGPASDQCCSTRLVAARSAFPFTWQMLATSAPLAGHRARSFFGETDPYGYNIVKNPVHVHDLHATLLHALGIDHEQLTYQHQGRRYRLTDVGGRVVEALLA